MIDLRRLRMALMSLGGPPQAQRHHMRVGLLARACATIEAVAPQVTALTAEAAIDASQAAAIETVGERLATLQPGWRERLAREPGKLGFDYLHSNAFEDPAWEQLRLAARTAFTAMRAPDNPRLG